MDDILLTGTDKELRSIVGYFGDEFKLGTVAHGLKRFVSMASGQRNLKISTALVKRTKTFEQWKHILSPIWAVNNLKMI